MDIITVQWENIFQRIGNNIKSTIGFGKKDNTESHFWVHTERKHLGLTKGL